MGKPKVSIRMLPSCYRPVSQKSFEKYPTLTIKNFKKVPSSFNALFISYYEIVEDETLSLIQEHWKPNKTLKVIGCINPLLGVLMKITKSKDIYYLGCCKL